MVFDRQEKDRKRSHSALSHRCLYFNVQSSITGRMFVFAFTAAILVIGFRLFARPGELCELKWSDVEIDKPKKNWIHINLSGHKTDFFFNDRPHPIDPVISVNSFCLVQILKTYMNLVKEFKSPDSPLLSFRDNQFLTTTPISELIWNAIRLMDSKTKVSGHSLRIGASIKISSKGWYVLNEMKGMNVSIVNIKRVWLSNEKYFHAQIFSPYSCVLICLVTLRQCRSILIESFRQGFYWAHHIF